MIIFTVPKPFKGEFDIIQRNAIDSWLSFKPKPKILLLGNEEGILAIAKQKQLIQIKDIKKNKYGTPLVNDIFAQAQKDSNKEVFMYINTDVVLLESPVPTIALLTKKFEKFLAVGRRYEIQIKKRMNCVEIKQMAGTSDLRQKNNSWMDYFIFTRGVFDSVPPFAIGKTFWDKWLVWNTLQQNIPTIDITDQLFAIHQSHSYSMNSKTNIKTVWTGEEALENLRLAGGWSHSATVGEASIKLTKDTIYPQKQTNRSKRFILDIFPSLWPFFLRVRLLREKYDSIVNKKR